MRRSNRLAAAGPDAWLQRAIGKGDCAEGILQRYPCGTGGRRHAPQPSPASPGWLQFSLQSLGQVPSTHSSSLSPLSLEFWQHAAVLCKARGRGEQPQNIPAPSSPAKPQNPRRVQALGCVLGKNRHCAENSVPREPWPSWSLLWLGMGGRGLWSLCTSIRRVHGSMWVHMQPTCSRPGISGTTGQRYDPGKPMPILIGPESPACCTVKAN